MVVLASNPFSPAGAACTLPARVAPVLLVDMAVPVAGEGMEGPRRGCRARPAQIRNLVREQERINAGVTAWEGERFARKYGIAPWVSRTPMSSRGPTAREPGPRQTSQGRGIQPRTSEARCGSRTKTAAATRPDRPWLAGFRGATASRPRRSPSRSLGPADLGAGAN